MRDYQFGLYCRMITDALEACRYTRLQLFYDRPDRGHLASHSISATLGLLYACIYAVRLAYWLY